MPGAFSRLSRVVELPIALLSLLNAVRAPQTGNNGRVLIRRESFTDIEAIRTVIASAFASPDQPGAMPTEVALVDDLRASDAWLPALSLVAIEPPRNVIGHVLCTRGYVGTAPVLALAPLSVHHDQQRRGIGQALMHTVLGAADALGEPLVALVGDPGYYRRFGFRLAQNFSISAPAPEWTPHFQARTLTAYSATPNGRFTYPAAFDRFMLHD
ncbi:MAG: GNAT family N-acetyltransferase [Pseudonocardiaceae bacterium]